LAKRHWIIIQHYSRIGGMYKHSFSGGGSPLFVRGIGWNPKLNKIATIIR
jgi:hypothetical protein